MPRVPDFSKRGLPKIKEAHQIILERSLTMFVFLYHKVKKCLARFSPRATTTNQPKTGHQMNQKGLYVPKKACVRAKMAVFGPKIPIFTGRGIGFGTHTTGKLPRHLVCIVFLVGHYLAKNANFGPNLAVFGPKMPILGQIWPFLGQKYIFWGGWSKTFGTIISGHQ